MVAELVRTKKRRAIGQNLVESWTEDCEHSFEGLRTKLTTAPVLAYASFTLPFILEIDASYGVWGLSSLKNRKAK